MPHKIHKGNGPLAGHKGAQQNLRKAGLLINKGKEAVKGAWQSDSNPIQAARNKAAGIADPKKGAAGRIQKKLVDKAGFSKTQLRNTADAHKAWKVAKKKGKGALKAWEKKYHSDRIKAGQSRYGN